METHHQSGYGIVSQWVPWAAELVLKAQILAALRAEAVVLVPTDGTIFVIM